MGRVVSLLLVLASLVGVVDAAGRTVRGRADVTDGDTFEVNGIAVRLQGVAAPEADEPGGKEATRFMRELVGGEMVACDLTGERTWGREVGVCRAGGRDVGAAIIQAGLARDCPRYSGGRYADLEPPAAKRLPFPGYCEPR